MISNVKLFVAQAGISHEEWCGFHVKMEISFRFRSVEEQTTKQILNTKG